MLKKVLFCLPTGLQPDSLSSVFGYVSKPEDFTVQTHVLPGLPGEINHG